MNLYSIWDVLGEGYYRLVWPAPTDAAAIREFKRMLKEDPVLRQDPSSYELRRVGTWEQTGEDPLEAHQAKHIFTEIAEPE